MRHAARCNHRREGGGGARRVARLVVAAAVALLAVLAIRGDTAPTALASAQGIGAGSDVGLLGPGEMCTWHGACESDACWGGVCCASNDWCNSFQCTPRNWDEVNTTILTRHQIDIGFMNYRDTAPYPGACLLVEEDFEWLHLCRNISDCMHCACDYYDRVSGNDGLLTIEIDHRGFHKCKQHLHRPCAWVGGDLNTCMPDLRARKTPIADNEFPHMYLVDWVGYGFLDIDRPEYELDVTRAFVRGGEWQSSDTVPGARARFGPQCPNLPLIDWPANWHYFATMGVWVLWGIIWPLVWICRYCSLRASYWRRREGVLLFYEQLANKQVTRREPGLELENLLWHGHYKDGHELSYPWRYWIESIVMLIVSSAPAFVHVWLMVPLMWGPAGDDQLFTPFFLFPGLASVFLYACKADTMCAVTEHKSQVYVLTTYRAIVIKVDWYKKVVRGKRQYFFTDMPAFKAQGSSLIFAYEVASIRKWPRYYKRVRHPVGFLEMQRHMVPIVYEMVLFQKYQRAVEIEAAANLIAEVVDAAARATIGENVVELANEAEEAGTEYDFSDLVMIANNGVDEAWYDAPEDIDKQRNKAARDAIEKEEKDLIERRRLRKSRSATGFGSGLSSGYSTSGAESSGGEERAKSPLLGSASRGRSGSRSSKKRSGGGGADNTRTRSPERVSSPERGASAGAGAAEVAKLLGSARSNSGRGGGSRRSGGGGGGGGAASGFSMV